MKSPLFFGGAAATALLATVVLAATGPLAVPAAAPRQSGALPAPKVAEQKGMNVLFIAVDDLLPAIGAYGGPIKTPHIDKLAARGTTFLKAYCQQAVCSPSRTSILTGLRPDATGVYDLTTHFRKNIPDVVTLPQYFKNNGYHTQGMGKIYHNGLDDAPSWSAPHQMLQKPTWGPEGMALQARVTAEAKAGGQDVKRILAPRGLAWESVADVPDNYFMDGATADKAIETMGEIKNNGKPFFLAVGFSKPHLPFVAPAKYWDLYKASDIKIPANNKEVPKDGVPIALTGWGELRAYHEMPKQGPMTDEQAKKLIHGYYASASYMDAQVGRVLDALDKQGLRDNTIVVLWGDHGWHLGDHGQWCKHTNFENGVRAPLLISVPGQRKKGTKTNALAEFVDVYPTLCEAAGLPAPIGVAGKSVLAATNDPNAATKPFAVSQYPRGGGKSGRASVMGYSLTDGRYRYTEWGGYGSELYDHQNDPAEDVNVAARPENKAVISKLSRLLHDTIPGAAAQAANAQALVEQAASKEGKR